jgi:hypothetical protein
MRLWIDNDAELSNYIYSLGEEVSDQIIMKILGEELERMKEQYVFNRRRKKLEDKDQLAHLRDVIRGVPWKRAKANLMDMTPGFAVGEMIIEDDEIEVV